MAALQKVWLADVEAAPDTYAAFRASFVLARDTEIELRFSGASWFQLWLDGAWLAEGPARFVAGEPEYGVCVRQLAAGRHVLAAQVHHLGVDTRMLRAQPPFWAAGGPFDLEWRGVRLEGYRATGRRTNPQLGWMEWCDTRVVPEGWRELDFDDGDWPAAVAQDETIPETARALIGPMTPGAHTPRLLAHGVFAEIFGYELDDPPARFFLRDLAPAAFPAQGFWRRYDLGRVRLGAPRFTLNAPAGTVIEFAYAEQLTQGRVAPYISFSAGPSSHLDHYVARGGEQEFGPFTPRGMRYLEVHVFAAEGAVACTRESFMERTYHGPPRGAFECDDALLTQIWATGVETYRACAEDAIIDNPTRERAQWSGDTLTVGLHVAAAAYGELRLVRRCLVQSAACADERGLAASTSPGQPSFAITYAAQWVGACLDYVRCTGEHALLQELRPAAERNLAALDALRGEFGLAAGADWVFIDWGCPAAKPGECDAPLNLRYLEALRAMMEWCALVNDGAGRERYATRAAEIADVLREHFRARADCAKIGYHAVALGLSAGLFPDERRAACREFLKRHLLDCFPNNADAPRLSDPAVSESRLITPYFAHFVFPLLIEHGEMDFVLEQYRRTWGWMLDQGLTTFAEVFDLRWSHCHHWSTCPTWQLSRYVLGLEPRLDEGDGVYVLNLRPGSLRRASGVVPLANAAGCIDVNWERTGETIHYRLRSPTPIRVRDAQSSAAERIATKWDGAAFALEREITRW